MSYIEITVYVGAHEKVLASVIERHAEIRLRGDSRIIMPIIGVLQGMGLISVLKPSEMPNGGGEKIAECAPDAPERATEGTKEEACGK